MSYDTSESYKVANRPGMIVLNHRGSVGFISEVSINECQIGVKDQLSYCVTWLHMNKDDKPKSAWWYHKDLIPASGGNLYDIIAKGLCHQMGNNKEVSVNLMKRGENK